MGRVGEALNRQARFPWAWPGLKMLLSFIVMMFSCLVLTTAEETLSTFDTTLILFAGAAFLLIILGFTYCFCCTGDDDDDVDIFNEAKNKEEQSKLEYDETTVEIMCANARVENLDIYASERKESSSSKEKWTNTFSVLKEEGK